MKITLQQAYIAANGKASKDRIKKAIKEGELKDYKERVEGAGKHYSIVESSEFRTWLASINPKQARVNSALSVDVEPTSQTQPFSKLASKVKAGPPTYEKELLSVLHDIRELLKALQ